MSLQNISISDDSLGDKLNANTLVAFTMDGKRVAESDAIDAGTADPNDNSDYSRVDDDTGNVNIQCVSNGLQVIPDYYR